LQQNIWIFKIIISIISTQKLCFLVIMVAVVAVIVDVVVLVVLLIMVDIHQS
jgi:hypothetical protein